MLGTFSLYAGGQLHGAMSSELLGSVKITMSVVSMPHPLEGSRTEKPPLLLMTDLTFLFELLMPH